MHRGEVVHLDRRRSHGPTFSPASREISVSADTGPLNVDMAATIRAEG